MDNQIAQLNTQVKVRLAPSPIHGVGVFALRDIASGEQLYADVVPTVYTLSYYDLDNLRPEIRELILEQWPNIINGSHFAYPTTRIQAFMNHSDQCNYDAKNDVVLTDIKAGEEVTEDYRAIESYPLLFPFLLHR